MSVIESHKSLAVTYAELLLKEVEQMQSMTEQKDAAPAWHTADEVPSDNERCVVVDANNACYFSSPINGRWMERVVYWMPLPSLPNNQKQN